MPWKAKSEEILKRAKGKKRREKNRWTDMESARDIEKVMIKQRHL